MPQRTPLTPHNSLRYKPFMAIETKFFSHGLHGGAIGPMVLLNSATNVQEGAYFVVCV